MNTRRLARLTLVAASVAMNLTVLALYLLGRFGDAGPLRPGHGPMSADLADELRLDDAARARVEALRAPVVERRAAIADDARTLRGEMIEAIVAGDAPRAEAVRARLVERQVAFQHEVVVYLAAVAADLDESRRETLRGMLRSSLFPGLGGQGPRRGGCPGP